MTLGKHASGAVLLCLLGLLSVPSFATSNCHQSFTFLGLTEGAPQTLWIVENKSGECNSTSLIQVVISDIGLVTVSTSAVRYGDWEWLKEGISHLRMEPSIELEHVEDKWSSPESSWRVRRPRLDSELAELWKEEVKHGKGRAEQWNKEYGRDGIIYPRFRGTRPALFYVYPAGLYFNYIIDRVYYFPSQGYILVFIRQPTLTIGGDTMHGFMLFKPKQPEKDWISRLPLVGMEKAREALTTFFSLLHQGRYTEAMDFYGGSYGGLRYWNPPVPRYDYATLLKYGCTINGLNCLLVKRVVSQQEISPGVFKFVVEFMDDQGRLFIRGPSCGGTEEQSPPQSQFTYTVKRWGDRFLVQELPVYTP